MAVGVAVVEEAAVGQVRHNGIIGVFDELAGKGIVAGDDAAQVHRLDKGELPVAAEVQVLIAKGGGDVDDAGTVIQGYEVAGYHPGGEVGSGFQVGYGDAAGAGTADEAADFGTVFGGMIEGLVASADQGGALDGGNDAVFVAEGGG